MPALINDPDLLRTVLRRRRADGHDRYDEVWNGVHVLQAMPNSEHQLLVLRMSFVLETLIGDVGWGRVLPGANVSDRKTGWKKNYRCPDVLVFWNDNPAVDRGEYWLGGPDLAIEILSPRDRARRRLPFYAQIGTREVLLVDRHPWQLELYRFDNGQMHLCATSTADNGIAIETLTAPVRWSLRHSVRRPELLMACTADQREWTA